MSWKQTLEKAGPGHWVLPKRKTMRCDAQLFLSDELLTDVEEDVFGQVVNACSFPGATRVVLTPDCHVGYGVPIGTAIETEGTLLPTAAGYDIGCGMVQLQTSLTKDDVADKEKRRMWIDEVVRRIGVGDLDHGQHIADRIHAGTAVFGRHFDAHQAVFAQRADVRQREFAGGIVVFGARRDLFLRNAARHVLDGQLFFGECKVHGRSRLVRKGRGPWPQGPAV